MKLNVFFKRHLTIALASFALTGCANMAPQGAQREAMLRAAALAPDDPLEQQNRAVLGFNKVVNDVAISPAAHVYTKLLPQIVRDRISNGVNNLQEPRIFANDVLQLRFPAAGTTLVRFVINSTLGLAGTFDVAAATGLPKQTGDFGQTLYVWGVSSGPYLILPILGPSDLRDAFGKVVDLGADPTTYSFAYRRFGVAYSDSAIAVGGAVGLENVELLDDLEAGSVDFYGRLRSTYQQKRASQLGDAVGVTVLPQTLPGPH